MTPGQGHQIQVPADLRQILLDFTVSYLLEQPGDVIDYAADYFHRLKDTLNSSIPHEGEQASLEQASVAQASLESAPDMNQGRRRSIFGEGYDPNEEDDDAPKTVYPKTEEQRQLLRETVRNVLFFRSLEPEQMEDLLDAMFERKVQEGELVIQQGEDGDNFYVIGSGVYQALKDDGAGGQKVVYTYENVGSFGELALLYNVPRAATIKAITSGYLWAMDRLTFRRIVLKAAYKKRKMYEELLDKVPMLKSLETYERMTLADALLPKYYDDGVAIIREGETADGMYFVESGEVRITIKSGDSDEIEVTRVGAGGYFGELALITHHPRAANVYAVGRVKLAFLDMDAFDRLLGPCMQIMHRNVKNYEEQRAKIFGSNVKYLH